MQKEDYKIIRKEDGIGYTYVYFAILNVRRLRLHFMNRVIVSTESSQLYPFRGQRLNRIT